ncbi:MAG: hypothetical protein JSS68_09990 [Actinobacteria bacterium]|nr:hypothetical protein [Actinomycetota bacterium]
MGRTNRRGGLGFHFLLIVLAALTGITAFIAVAAGAESPAGARDRGRAAASSGRTVQSGRYGYSLSLPAGWHRAPHRLVPRLLDPREILSLGAGPLPVGGGGDCRRDPITAIDRMRSGDALITIQEEAEGPGMRRVRLRERHDAPSLPEALSSMHLLRELHPPGEHVPASQQLRYTQVGFTEDGRSLDALLWVKGPPAPARVRQVKAILSSIDFRRGTFVRFPRREVGFGRECVGSSIQPGIRCIHPPAADRPSRRRLYSVFSSPTWIAVMAG